MMRMTVVGMVVQRCRVDAADGDQRERRGGEEEGTCGPSPVNRACGAVLHVARELAPLRPLRR